MPVPDVTQDKDFMAAPLSDKFAYLSHVDADFAKASPADQQAYVNHITKAPNAPESTPSDVGPKSPIPENYGFTVGNMWNAAKEGTGELARGVGQLVDPRVPVFEGKNSLYHQMIDPLAEEEKKGESTTGTESFGHKLASYIPIFGPAASSFGEQSGRGDVGGAFARSAPQAIAMAATDPSVREATGTVLRNVRDAVPSSSGVARVMRNPETGALKPRVRVASSVLGAAAGGLTGLIGGHEYGPYGGMFVGSSMGPKVIEALTPTLPEGDLTEGQINHGVRNARIAEQVKLRTAPPSAPGPELGSPENPGKFVPLKTRMPESRLGSPRNPGWVEKLSGRVPKPASPTPEIAGPSASPPSATEPHFSGSEGRAATWKNADVIRIYNEGDVNAKRTAIQQMISRGMPLPDNARYIMGDANYPRAVYNPRETTKFEGTQIRNMQKNPVSSRKNIALPQTSNAVRIPGLNDEEFNNRRRSKAAD